MAETVQEVLCLARLYLSEVEIGRLVVCIANRLGRNQALAGNRAEIERLEHVARHWLSDEECESLARWMLMQAGRGEPVVPTRPVGRPERRKG